MATVQGTDFALADISKITSEASVEEGSGRRVVIVSVAGDVDEAASLVEETIESASIRRLYKEVYGGFSLDLLEEDIPMLEQLSVIARVDDVAIYQPS